MTVMNLQKPTNHLFKITKKDTTAAMYQLQAVNIPAISAATADGPSIKTGDYAMIGTSITFGDLVCTFLLDENMDAYPGLELQFFDLIILSLFAVILRPRDWPDYY